MAILQFIISTHYLLSNCLHFEPESKNPPDSLEKPQFPPLASHLSLSVKAWIRGMEPARVLKLMGLGWNLISTLVTLQALWLWASCLVSRKFIFPTFKIRIIMPASWGCFWVGLLNLANENIDTQLNWKVRQTTNIFLVLLVCPKYCTGHTNC